MDAEKEKIIETARIRRLFALLPELLKGVIGKEIPLDRFLTSFFRANTSCGSRDRREISHFFYALFRHWGMVKKLHATAEDSSFPEQFSGEKLSRLFITGLLLEGRKTPPPEEVLQKAGVPAAFYVELSALPLEKMLEKWSHFCGNTPLNFSEEDLMPEWMKEFLPFPVDERYFRLPLARANTYCRIRYLSDREKVEKEFASLGKKLFFHPQVPHAFHWEGEEDDDRRLAYSNMKSYREGAFEVQDLSSQLIAHTALMPRNGENSTILDYCCGAGGKTLLMASRMGKKGKICYSDIRQEILPEVEKRLRRGKLTRAFPWTGKEEKFDIVLADAPCSSSGRVRHSPELWHLLTPEKVMDFQKLQLQILEEAGKYVKEGGFLCYGTCSLFTAENEEITRKFPLQNKDFELVDIHSPLSGEKLPFLKILPWDGNCDGSFSCLFRKRTNNNS